MATLAINTSANFVSVALLDQFEVIHQLDSRVDYHHAPSITAGKSAGSDDQLPPGYTQKRSKRGQSTQRVFPPGASVMLAPLMNELFQKAALSPTELELICVAKGPGKFTGLRVGVVTAKTLAYASKTPIIGVNTLEAIAAQTFATEPHLIGDSRLQVITNAQRQQFFAAAFRAKQDEPASGFQWQVELVSPDQIIDRQVWIEQLQVGDVVTGTGLKPIVQQMSEMAQSEKQINMVDESAWALTAASVGKLGWQKHLNGESDDLWTLEPDYFRPSAAEEKRLG
ncbi:MAG: tRNA (adenosine(37)-N6)-threonylcarbamoyltransferase complex dimerization subunit type 1 TsaB [Planctomycetota bacterium]